ncbi:2Fe-2S iron-sulfur cluster-binding protein [Streptomyces sp. NPDC002057]|uniref:2Fe-2S iron-sulfur cluster-binding protein n=1 Tax=Streptomyces sp. NPDC002057 TaxID=3154664 RepID=UPI003327325C
MSSDEQQQNSGGWEPIPQSEGYDGDATAFVQLPPDFMLDGVPLEAPGHGYVPPMITPLQPLAPTPETDPAATGQWSVHLPTQAEQPRYFDGAEYAERDPSFQGAEQFRTPPYVDRPGQVEYTEQPEHFGRNEQFGRTGHDGRTGHGEQAGYAERDPQATAEWRFTGAPAPAADSGATGQWTIPVETDTVEGAEAAETYGAGEAGDEPEGFAPRATRQDLPTPPVPPYAEAPATLPGGAPAPWALPAEPVTEAAEASAEPGDGRDPHPQTGPDAGPDGEAVPDETTAAAATAPDGDGEAGAAPDAGEATDTPDAVAGAPEPEPVVEPAVEPEPAPAVYASTDSDEHPHTSYTLRVNGADRPVTGAWIGESLLYVLRERLGLAGAKDGCSQGECGACNVQVDGRLVASCLVPAATAAGSEVRTVEGLAVDGEPSDVQRAMAKCGTVQCGFCIPGMCMTVHDLLEGNHAPTELEARQALAGNLCRCSGYRGVLEAVRDVVTEREASAAATASDAADEPRVPHQIPHPHDGGMA